MNALRKFTFTQAHFVELPRAKKTFADLNSLCDHHLPVFYYNIFLGCWYYLATALTVLAE
jgi:hypothetical protein